MALIDTVRPQSLGSKAAPLVGYSIDLTTIYFSGREGRRLLSVYTLRAIS